MKTVMLNFRLTPEQRRVVVAKAKARGESLKEYFLNATLYRESRGKVEGLEVEDPFLRTLAMVSLDQEPEPVPKEVATVFKRLDAAKKAGNAKMLSGAEALKHLKARRSARRAEAA